MHRVHGVCGVCVCVLVYVRVCVNVLSGYSVSSSRGWPASDYIDTKTF